MPAVVRRAAGSCRTGAGGGIGDRHVNTSTFLPLAHLGPVRIVLDDGQIHTGNFRTDILSERAVSAFFFGDVRPLSLPIDGIVSIEALATSDTGSMMGLEEAAAA
jgi:hypothetical protein